MGRTHYETEQSRLETLATRQKQGVQDENEQLTLKALMTKAQEFMLRKAEARRILAQRGHTIFSTSDSKID